MKIEKVRVRHVFGTIETDGVFWEERMVTPLDVYPEFRNVTDLFEWSKQNSPNTLSFSRTSETVRSGTVFWLGNNLVKIIF